MYFPSVIFPYYCKFSGPCNNVVSVVFNVNIFLPIPSLLHDVFSILHVLQLCFSLF